MCGIDCDSELDEAEGSSTSVSSNLTVIVLIVSLVVVVCGSIYLQRRRTSGRIELPDIRAEALQASQVTTVNKGYDPSDAESGLVPMVNADEASFVNLNNFLRSIGYTNGGHINESEERQERNDPDQMGAAIATTPSATVVPEATSPSATVEIFDESDDDITI